jgi:hypothetical protein
MQRVLEELCSVSMPFCASQPEPEAASPGRPSSSFEMHPRLEHFIAVVEVQFLLDIIEVDARARSLDLAATTIL